MARGPETEAPAADSGWGFFIKNVRAQVALGVIAQRRNQFRGRQLHGAGLVQRLPEILLEFVRGGALDRPRLP
jgi:hypothetical protein